MTQKQSQPPNPPLVKEVNHTSHWQHPLQSSSSYHPTYQHSNSRSECQPHYHSYPSAYYQPYNYASTMSQSHPTQPAITYLSQPLQITYPATNTQTIQTKMEPNTLQPPPAQHPEPSQQNNNFPTFGTIHAIIGGSNLDFQNKQQKREYYHQVNHVTVEGPITQTKLSHIPLTFTEADIKLVSFPHTDARLKSNSFQPSIRWSLTESN
jgi:hypothetical protein